MRSDVVRDGPNVSFCEKGARSESTTRAAASSVVVPVANACGSIAADGNVPTSKSDVGGAAANAATPRKESNVPADKPRSKRIVNPFVNEVRGRARNKARAR